MKESVQATATIHHLPKRRDFGCPSWCERTTRDHDADVVDDENPPMHYGPTFGVFWIQARGDGQPEVAGHDLSAFGTLNGVTALIKIADDAASAGEWLVKQAKLMGLTWE